MSPPPPEYSSPWTEELQLTTHRTSHVIMTVASVPEHLLPVDVKTLETFPYFRCVARCSILAMYNYNQLSFNLSNSARPGPQC